MKQYVIDEFRPGDAHKVKKHLEKVFGPAKMDSIFWIPVPEDLLTGTQAAHENCQPFYFAVDVNDEQIACELLVRSRNTIRCNCIAYASRSQREWLISYIDSIFEALDIIT